MKAKLFFIEGRKKERGKKVMLLKLHKMGSENGALGF